MKCGTINDSVTSLQDILQQGFFTLFSDGDGSKNFVLASGSGEFLHNFLVL